MRQTVEESGTQTPRLAEKATRLRPRKPGQTGGLVIGRDLISALDQLGDVGRQLRRQTEAHMNGREQLGLESAIVERQRRLERADQVADDIFRRIVDQSRQPELAV